MDDVVLSRYSHRCSGCYVDVEGIVEDCGFRIIPREGGLRKLVEGYVATDPRFIVVSEPFSSYAPRYRPLIAEEFCHAILEYDILKEGKIPENAHPHRLTPEQHRDIEADAQYLSLAVLFPREKFRSMFTNFVKMAPPATSNQRLSLLKWCCEKMETEFHVWSLKVAYRARDLGLMGSDECTNYFSNRLAF